MVIKRICKSSKIVVNKVWNPDFVFILLFVWAIGESWGMQVPMTLLTPSIATEKQQLQDVPNESPEHVE